MLAVYIFEINLIYIIFTIDFIRFMIKKILFLFCFVCSINLNAQTGIGTTTPNPSAKLDVSSSNKGFCLREFP